MASRTPQARVTKTRDFLERPLDLEVDQEPVDEFEIAWNSIMPSRPRERKKD